MQNIMLTTRSLLSIPRFISHPIFITNLLLQRPTVCCCIANRYSSFKKTPPDSRKKIDISSRRSYHPVYEPAYLDKPPKIPFYECLQVRIRGYDFAVLENYSRYVHRTSKNLGLDAISWAVPARTTLVERFKPNSSIVDSTYELIRYERKVEVKGLTTPLLPIYLELLQAHLPPGTSFRLQPRDETEEEFRYIPDLDLRDLYKQLEVVEEEMRSK